MHALRRLRARVGSTRELWLLIRIGTLATLLPLLTRSLSLPDLMLWMTPKRPCGDAGRIPPQRLVGLVEMVLRRDLWIYRPNCLKRALLLYRFLHQTGRPVQLCIGVRATGPSHPGSTIDGHAWLQFQGVPYLEPLAEQVPSYRVTFSYPPGSEQVTGDLSSGNDSVVDGGDNAAPSLRV